MRIRKLAAIAAALAPLAVAAQAAEASAATTPPASPVLTFVPPHVGPLQVSIGATLVGDQQISPGVNVSTPGVSLPPITWTPLSP